MITQARALITTTLLIMAVFITPVDVAADRIRLEEGRYRVIDGDTMEIRGGERVRLVGVDTPEAGEPFYQEAGFRLSELVAALPTFIETCEERDRYGRILATVRTAGANANLALLREGMGLPMLIPPCGRAVAGSVLEASVVAALAQKGVYSLGRHRIIGHEDAGRYIGQAAIIRGTVLTLHKGPKAWHLNFGADWKTDFTAVLFGNGRERFEELGIDPESLLGREVLVRGKIKEYYGPEIVVSGPDQIIPVDDRSEASRGNQ